MVENQPLSAREEPPTAAPRPGQRPAWGIQSRDITRSKRQRIHLAQRLIAESGPALRRASAPAVASVLRPWLAAGWTLADVRWALDHAPDGAHHWYSESVRDPIGWLRHRLADWTDGSGAPLPPAGGYQRAKDASRTSRLASAEHSRQQDERQREEARRALANASPEVRQMLEAARRRRALRPGRQHSPARPGPSPVSECQHGNPIGGCWHWRCR